MRVAVTGATGNVGTAVVRALVEDDRISEIVAIARRRPDSPSSPTVRYVAADVTRDDLHVHLTDVDAVVHLAWKIQPTHRPLETWETNVLGSVRVFEAAADAGVSALVHASSIGAYSPGPADGRPVDESWPTDSLPTAGYGREKAYVERVLDTFERDHPEVRVVRLRPAFIFQRSAASEQRRLFMGPLVPRPLIGRLPVLPLPRGLRVQAVHADDVAEAYRRAVVGEVRGAFNIAAEPMLDADGVAAVLGARALRVPPRLVRSLLSVGWRARLVPAEPSLFDLFIRLPTISSQRARDELGWSPRHSSHEALGELVGGLRDGAGGTTPPLVPDNRLARS